jgi:hypothetical protein
VAEAVLVSSTAGKARCAWQQVAVLVEWAVAVARVAPAEEEGALRLLCSAGIVRLPSMPSSSSQRLVALAAKERRGFSEVRGARAARAAELLALSAAVG